MDEPHPIITIDLVCPSRGYVAWLLNGLLKAQVLDRHLTKDVLRAILHAILFHRLFGTVKPKTFEILDVTMVRCVDCLSKQSHPLLIIAGSSRSRDGKPRQRESGRFLERS